MFKLNLIFNCLSYLGIMFAIASNDSSDILPMRCLQNHTAEAAEFRYCLEKSKPSIFSRINLEAYEHKLTMNKFGVYEILIPSDGSITNDPSPEATLYLNASLDYFVFLFDKSFMFPFNIPLIAKRTYVRLLPNLSMFQINLKVLCCVILRLL